MRTRRNVLIGSCGAIAALAAKARAEIAPDGFLVLRAARLAGASEPSALAFAGAVPGPIIRARRGEEVKVRLVNALEEPTAIHWHGVHVPNAMDGTPPLTPAIAPGASFDYRFVALDAGTFLYRASFAGQQERGLYGALIVTEPQPPTVDRDEVLVFADAAASKTSGEPVRATVNGAPRADIAVRQNERLRLRFVNASPAQPMRARIPGHRVIVMALDGEPAEPFSSRDSAIMLASGGRADVFVDATATLGTIAPIEFAHQGGADTLVRLVYDGGSAAHATPLGEPSPLPANPLPSRIDLARALRVTVPILPAAANAEPQRLFAVERGRSVVMALAGGASAATVHVHGHHFRLLDRLDDGWKPYWLDTMIVFPSETHRIAFVADNPGRWLIEQRALEGSTSAAAWFAVS